MDVRLDLEAVKKDIRWLQITKAEWAQIQRVISDVANSRQPKRHPQIMEIQQTECEWWRIKDMKTNTRTVVEFRRIRGEEVMVVKHVLRRCGNMYDFVEIFWRVERGMDTRR